MIHDCVIIGGGVAGLCAAIRLAELGVVSLVLEGGHYPTHKVCGEFLSPECLVHLDRWKIPYTPIHHMHIRTPHFDLPFSFPYSAGGSSHLCLDPALANHAQTLGVDIRLHTQVKSFRPKSKADEYHQIELGNGEIIQSRYTMISTGRIPSYHCQPPQFPFIGIKAHFKKISIEHTLEMFACSDAYLGIAPLENGVTNIACLAHRHAVEHRGSIEVFMTHLIDQHPLLKSYLLSAQPLFSEWMYTPVPSFGKKEIPNWLDVYFIGDAILTVPPACGGGLSLAIIGGQLAAEKLIQQKKDFNRQWQRHCTSQIFWAKVLHQMMMNPSLSTPFLYLGSIFPTLSRKIFHLTRHKPKKL